MGSSATIFKMKIILPLFGFFLTGSCLPASKFPPCFPYCDQNNNAIQNCQNGQCNQNNQFGGNTGGGGGTAQQNCQGSQCNQNNNFGRKKRGISIDQNNAVGGASGFGGFPAWPFEQNSPNGFSAWPQSSEQQGGVQTCIGTQCTQNNPLGAENSFNQQFPPTKTQLQEDDDDDDDDFDEDD